jgi:hypothetical protein
MILLSSTVQEWSRSRIHERAIKLSILGMIWREFSSKAVEVSVNNKEENCSKFSGLRPRIQPQMRDCRCKKGTLSDLIHMTDLTNDDLFIREGDMEYTGCGNHIVEA